MTHFMEEKTKILEGYICALDDAITKSDEGKAKELQTEIIAVYEPEIPALKDGLDNYSFDHAYAHKPADNIGDAKLLKGKLQNYKLNLAAGLYRPFQNADSAVSVTQQVNQDVSTEVVITLDQVISSIQDLPETELSAEDKDILSGKIAAISSEKDKEKRWEKVSGTLKWIAEKGLQVGIAALPYIAKALEATS